MVAFVLFTFSYASWTVSSLQVWCTAHTTLLLRALPWTRSLCCVTDCPLPELQGCWGVRTVETLRKLRYPENFVPVCLGDDGLIGSELRYFNSFPSSLLTAPSASHLPLYSLARTIIWNVNVTLEPWSCPNELVLQFEIHCLVSCFQTFTNQVPSVWKGIQGFTQMSPS